MTQEELEALCRTWQKRLRLQDWTVKVRIVRRHELDHADIQGQVTWVLSRREALIKLLDPIDYLPDCVLPQDLETTLVHELVHLYFAPFDAEDGTLEDIYQEQAIDGLSKALVELASSCNSTPTPT